MQRLENFFDLTPNDTSELGLKIVHTADRALVSAQSGDLFEILNKIGSDEQRDIRKYFVSFCFSGFPGEAQTSRLLLRDTDETIGYVFPVTAFRDGNSIEGGEWPRRFADVGFRTVVSLSFLKGFTLSKSLSDYRGKSSVLDELIPDSLSILVVSRQILETSKIELPTLELMLRKEQIAIARALADLPFLNVATDWRRTLSLSKPNQRVEAEASIFLDLLKSADKDITGVGAFMHLYQAMEFCIDHIFNWSVRNIAQNVSDIWEMKDQLAKIASERHRLSVLDSQCLSRLNNRTTLTQLRDSCAAFLRAIEIDHDVNSSWFILLYQARNILVHNQIKMMRAPSVPLRQMNASLRAASLDVLFFFDEPANQPAD